MEACPPLIPSKQKQAEAKMPRQSKTTKVVEETQETTTLRVEVSMTTEKRRGKTLSEEHKQAISEGVKRAVAERRKAAHSPEDPCGSPSSDSKARARKAATDEVEKLQQDLAELSRRMQEALQRVDELESSSEEEEEEELPKFKADGTLDLRFKASRQMLRKDGGLNKSYKAVKNAIGKGLVKEDGTLLLE
jgi:flagellar motility protein MotE (MotC chaperone)